MNLKQRIELLVKLGHYMAGSSEDWEAVKEKAYAANGWFLPQFINLSVKNIAEGFLQKGILEKWVSAYPGLLSENKNPALVGIVMAGNIPLVGFHDFLCVFISGHRCVIKASSKDEILIKHLVETLIKWEPGLESAIQFQSMLKNCDAYIATGSNSSAGYFEYYFGKYPHIIRRNRSSVAILDGKEDRTELEALADDVYSYFGMGCRNITKVYVPEGYDFISLIDAFRKYDHLADHHKYKNNYDYNLALHILNNKVYMSNASLLFVEDENIFSPVSQLHYETYTDRSGLIRKLENNKSLQCIVGPGFLPFGQAQCPAIDDYADGVNTLRFLEKLGIDRGKDSL